RIHALEQSLLIALPAKFPRSLVDCRAWVRHSRGAGPASGRIVRALPSRLEKRKARVAVRRAIAVGVFAVLGLLSLQAVAYWKFGTFNGAPLRYNVQYTPERLARIDGKILHAANLPHNLHAYVLRPSFQAVSRFPFLLFDLKPSHFPE